VGLWISPATSPRRIKPPIRRGYPQQHRQTFDGEDAAATGVALPILSGQVPGSALECGASGTAFSGGGFASLATTGAGLPKDKAEAELPHSKGAS